MAVAGCKHHSMSRKITYSQSQKRLCLQHGRCKAAFQKPFIVVQRRHTLTNRHMLHHLQAATQSPAASETELEMNKKRWEESGGSQGSVDNWRWSLNWDDITPDIVVGSCPRSPADLDRIAEEANATAVLCLQSDVCMEAMQIDWGAIRDHGVRRNVLLVRVATRDFDHFDQAFMLPEAVKTLAALLALGRRVYVHCTAGINRASLTVVGYLTFMQGMTLSDALHVVKSKRSQAHPYVDCWKTARARLLDGCDEQVAAKAKQLWVKRQKEGSKGEKDDLADWVAAEDYVVSQLLKRQLGCTLSMVSSMKDLQETSMASTLAATSQPREETLSSLTDIKRITTFLKDERMRLREALAQLGEARKEIDELRNGVCSVTCEPDPELVQELETAQETLEVTRALMRQMWSRSSSVLAGNSTASMDELPM